jgi:hypothetical protein
MTSAFLRARRQCRLSGCRRPGGRKGERPPEKWDICGAARRCGLVGFVWGSREASGGSCSWAYSAPWCPLRGGLAAKAATLAGTIECYAWCLGGWSSAMSRLVSRLRAGDA